MTLPIDTIKVCIVCKETQPLDNFRDRHNQCKNCERDYARNYRARFDVQQRNREYMKSYNPKYQKANRESILKQRREYHRRNRDKISNQRRKYRERNKANISQQQRKYRKNNLEKIKQVQKEYLQRPEVRVRKRTPNRVKEANRRAQKRILPNTLTTVQWQHALNYFNGCCAVCGRQLNDMFGEFTAASDHWIPLSYKGDDNPGTVVGNIIPLCHGAGGCNNSKSATTPNEWLEQKFGKHKAKKITAKVKTYFDTLR